MPRRVHPIQRQLRSRGRDQEVRGRRDCSQRLIRSVGAQQDWRCHEGYDSHPILRRPLPETRLPSGRYQVRYPTLTNELINAPRTFSSYKEADEYLAVVKADQLRVTCIDHRSATITFRDYAEQWMVDRRIKETTEAKYKGLLDRQILPKFGAIQLGKITTQSIRSWNTTCSPITRTRPLRPTA